MTDLLTVSYRSIARLRERANEIEAIMSESHERNQRLGVTGILLFDGTYFMQTIEGPADEIGAVFLMIASDKRHTDVVPFGISRISDRSFPTWRMKLIEPEATTLLVPDMEGFAFTDRRLGEIHAAVKKAAA